eukprot:m.242907 g.242907  ORF g.242907 m.242907 type:complete len:69 (-) comp17139_c0_seq4:3890-4096(-)
MLFFACSSPSSLQPLPRPPTYNTTAVNLGNEFFLVFYSCIFSLTLHVNILGFSSKFVFVLYCDCAKHN